MTHRWKWLGYSLVFTALLVAAWQAASDYRLVSPIFLPAPSRAWNALVYNLGAGILGPRIWLTLQHMFLGWLLASVVGVAIGSVIGVSRTAREYFAPILEFFRPLPASAVFPIAISFIGLTEKMVVFVIAFGALWPTLLATVNGFATLRPRLIEFSRLIDMRKLDFITKIALPNALPEILAGMRFSLTIALILSVTGEILAGSPGLGHWTLLQARAFRTPDLFAGVLLFGVIGYSSSQLLALLEGRFLRWRGDVFARNI